MSEQLMSPRQVAARYPVSYADLKRDLRTGVAPHIPVGKGAVKTHRRMTEAQVHEYLARKQAQAAQPAPAEPEPDRLTQAVEATRRRQRRRTGHRPY